MCVLAIFLYFGTTVLNKDVEFSVSVLKLYKLNKDNRTVEIIGNFLFIRTV